MVEARRSAATRRTNCRNLVFDIQTSRAVWNSPYSGELENVPCASNFASSAISMGSGRAPTVKVDGRREVLGVTEASGLALDAHDLAVEPLGHAVGDWVPHVAPLALEVSSEHARDLLAPSVSGWPIHTTVVVRPRRRPPTDPRAHPTCPSAARAMCHGACSPRIVFEQLRVLHAALLRHRCSRRKAGEQAEWRAQPTRAAHAIPGRTRILNSYICLGWALARSILSARRCHSA